MKTNPLANCVKAAGSPAGGILLYRLQFWNRAGYETIAKTLTEWGEETGLSVKQVRSAINDLETRGLVTLQVAIFGGRKRTHLTPTETGLNPRSICPPGQEHLPSGANHYMEIQQGGILHTSYSEYAACASTPEQAPSGEDDEMVKYPGLTKGKPMAEVLAESKQKAALQPKPKGNDAQPLALCWQNGLSKYHGQFAGAVSVVEKGMLKQWGHFCPPGRGCDMLDVIMERWQEMCADLTLDNVIYKPPKVPKIKFILAHRTEMATWALKALGVIAPSVSDDLEPPKIPVHGGSQTKVSKPAAQEEKKATLADLYDEDDDV